MKTTPYELVFGQPPRQSIFPGVNKARIMEEDIEDLLDDNGRTALMFISVIKSTNVDCYIQVTCLLMIVMTHLLTAMIHPLKTMGIFHV